MASWTAPIANPHSQLQPPTPSPIPYDNHRCLCAPFYKTPILRLGARMFVVKGWTAMIDQLKAELERRTGLPASVVDQVVTALGQILAERYPQYMGMIGPLLGLPATGTTTPGTTTPGTTTPGTTPGTAPTNPGLGPIP